MPQGGENLRPPSMQGTCWRMQRRRGLRGPVGFSACISVQAVHDGMRPLVREVAEPGVHGHVLVGLQERDRLLFSTGTLDGCG